MKPVDIEDTNESDFWDLLSERTAILRDIYDRAVHDATTASTSTLPERIAVLDSLVHVHGELLQLEAIAQGIDLSDLTEEDEDGEDEDE